MTLEKIILELTHINQNKSALLSPIEGKAIQEAIYWLTNYLGSTKLKPEL